MRPASLACVNCATKSILAVGVGEVQDSLFEHSNFGFDLVRLQVGLELSQIIHGAFPMSSRNNKSWVQPKIVCDFSPSRVNQFFAAAWFSTSWAFKYLAISAKRASGEDSDMSCSGMGEGGFRSPV